MNRPHNALRTMKAPARKTGRVDPRLATIDGQPLTAWLFHKAQCMVQMGNLSEEDALWCAQVFENCAIDDLKEQAS